MLNKVMLIGNLGKDPIVRKLENGNTVASFSLATSESYKDKEGNKQTKSEWHNIVIWGKPAEIVEKYLHKGDKIYLEGKITTRQYEQEGQKKYTTEIVASSFNFLETKQGQASGNTPQASKEEAAKEEYYNEAPPTEQDDLPF